ncbi:hypothetical protein CYLTODRAFT_491715 [Cylindrobasidium torrendii FP15055 ss-10]|uniref:Uncharacterized protein n=1 Tax=Cylindrobasidium torrendii FP15055 ss-10 TaxID=1314674 RepID=A0A0D7B7H4_9AGAR|nr:hypothetical protein CYLTODRAFT_491715 [Cylindrobasidium torrendii FP15055 ss-10]
MATRTTTARLPPPTQAPQTRPPTSEARPSTSTTQARHQNTTTHATASYGTASRSTAVTPAVRSAATSRAPSPSRAKAQTTSQAIPSSSRAIPTTSTRPAATPTSSRPTASGRHTPIQPVPTWNPERGAIWNPNLYAGEPADYHIPSKVAGPAYTKGAPNSSSYDYDRKHEREYERRKELEYERKQQEREYERRRSGTASRPASRPTSPTARPTPTTKTPIVLGTAKPPPGPKYPLTGPAKSTVPQPPPRSATPPTRTATPPNRSQTPPSRTTTPTARLKKETRSPPLSPLKASFVPGQIERSGSFSPENTSSSAVPRKLVKRRPGSASMSTPPPSGDDPFVYVDPRGGAYADTRGGASSSRLGGDGNVQRQVFTREQEPVPISSLVRRAHVRNVSSDAVPSRHAVDSSRYPTSTPAPREKDRRWPIIEEDSFDVPASKRGGCAPFVERQGNETLASAIARAARANDVEAALTIGDRPSREMPTLRARRHTLAAEPIKTPTTSVYKATPTVANPSTSSTAAPTTIRYLSNGAPIDMRDTDIGSIFAVTIPDTDKSEHSGWLSDRGWPLGRRNKSHEKESRRSKSKDASSKRKSKDASALVPIKASLDPLFSSLNPISKHGGATAKHGSSTTAHGRRNSFASSLEEFPKRSPGYGHVRRKSVAGAPEASQTPTSVPAPPPLKKPAPAPKWPAGTRFHENMSVYSRAS